MTYSAAYKENGGNEQAANEAAAKVIKKQAAQAARSAVWKRLKELAPFQRAVKGADSVKGAIATTVEGMGVTMCAIVAEKMVNQEFGSFAPSGPAGEKMLDFKQDAAFKVWIKGEHDVTEQWLKDSNKDGQMQGYQQKFLDGYTGKLTATYSDLKCTYFAFFTKGNVPQEERTFCTEHLKGNNTLMTKSAS